MVNWKIWYTDYTTFSNLDGSIEEAPFLGVQVIAQVDEIVGRVLIQNGDYYWMYLGKWYGGDIAGVYTYLITTGEYKPSMKFDHPFQLLEWMTGSGLVKLGEMLRGDKFTEIYNMAADDPDMPRKTAFHPQEKRGPWANQ